MKKTTMLVSLCGCLLAGSALGQTTYHGFEASETGIDYFAFAGASAGTSTAVVFAGAQALEISLDTETNYGRAHWLHSGALGITTATARAYVSGSSTSTQPLHPFWIFDIDVDGDNTFDGGVLDAQVIAFSNDTSGFGPGLGRDAWFDLLMDGLTNVHVVGNRPGLAPGTFSSSGTQGSLNSLSAMPTGVGLQTWGDLNVFGVRIGMGLAGGSSGTLLAYADEAFVTTVPVPGAAGVFAGAGLLTMRRRRR